MNNICARRWGRQLLGVMMGATASVMSVAEQPNIVFIMADDMGWSDTSNRLTNMNHPSDFFETPTLESIAAEGMAFDNAYTTGPNCAPTRAALLTGQYAPRPTNNVYLVYDLNRADDETLLVGPPQGLPGTEQDAIPSHAVTLAESLKAAGYKTAHVGKFHVTESSRHITSDHGFDVNYGGDATGGPGDYHAVANWSFGERIGPELDIFAEPYTQEYVDRHIKPYSVGVETAQMDKLVGTEKHVSDAITDAAIEFMANIKQSPFFIHYSAYAVHGPTGRRHARQDLLAKYDQKPAGKQDSDPSFAALLEQLDQNVARLIDYLSTTHDPRNPSQTLADNTLVIFYSDNGGRLDKSNNGPLTGQKGELTEGGIRVPMIAWSKNPRLVQGRSLNSTPVATIDFYPTFLELAGYTDTQALTLDGESLVDLFTRADTPLKRDHLFWHVPGYLIHDGRHLLPQTIVRSGDWKLVYLHETDHYRLFHLPSDISEQNNLLDRPLTPAEQTKANTMASAMQAWMHNLNAPMPTLRTTGETLPIPQHKPGATFFLDGRDNFALNKRRDVTLEKNGISLRLKAIGQNAQLSQLNGALGVVSANDQGGTNARRRINGASNPAEALELTFSQTVYLKELFFSQVDTQESETLLLSMPEGQSIFSALRGYSSEFLAQSHQLLVTPADQVTNDVQLSFGQLLSSEIQIPANTPIRISTHASATINGGVRLKAIKIAR